MLSEPLCGDQNSSGACCLTLYLRKSVRWMDFHTFKCISISKQLPLWFGYSFDLYGTWGRCTGSICSILCYQSLTMLETRMYVGVVHFVHITLLPVHSVVIQRQDVGASLQPRVL